MAFASKVFTAWSNKCGLGPVGTFIWGVGYAACGLGRCESPSVGISGDAPNSPRSLGDGWRDLGLDKAGDALSGISWFVYCDPLNCFIVASLFTVFIDSSYRVVSDSGSRDGSSPVGEFSTSRMRNGFAPGLFVIYYARILANGLIFCGLSFVYNSSSSSGGKIGDGGSGFFAADS
jgi:hypothetical protein